MVACVKWSMIVVEWNTKASSLLTEQDLLADWLVELALLVASSASFTTVEEAAAAVLLVVTSVFDVETG